jgi:hypothetical protein
MALIYSIPKIYPNLNFWFEKTLYRVATLSTMSSKTADLLFQSFSRLTRIEDQTLMKHYYPFYTESNCMYLFFLL